MKLTQWSPVCTAEKGFAILASARGGLAALHARNGRTTSAQEWMMMTRALSASFVPAKKLIVTCSAKGIG